MTSSEQAKKYAEGKVYEALTAVVEKAFADGYDAGYKDAIAELKVEPDVEENGITYVDLGLPSGTLWASDYLRGKDGKLEYLSFGYASPLSLPTKAQVEELLSYCTVSLNTKGFRLVENEQIYDLVNNNKKISLSSQAFWIRGSDSPNLRSHEAVFQLQKVSIEKTAKLLVRLVKNKK